MIRPSELGISRVNPSTITEEDREAFCRHFSQKFGDSEKLVTDNNTLISDFKSCYEERMKQNHGTTQPKMVRKTSLRKNRLNKTNEFRSFVVESADSKNGSDGDKGSF